MDTEDRKIDKEETGQLWRIPIFIFGLVLFGGGVAALIFFVKAHQSTS